MDEKGDSIVTENLLSGKSTPSAAKKNANLYKAIIGALIILVICLIVALILSLATNTYISKNSSTGPTEKANHDKSTLIQGSELESVKKEQLPKLNSIWNNFQLPPFFKPSYYTLDLKIDVVKREFYANCSITFKCFEDNKFLVLHSGPNLKYLGANKLPVIKQINEFSNNITGQLSVAKIEINEFYSYIIIVLKRGQTFKKGQTYSVNFINYYSEITDNLKGIYYSTYMSNNTQSTLVVSQLQPLDARRVFPSFDEPSLKAKFRISITHQRDYSALSNMEEVAFLDIDDTWRKTQFNTTPIMSTYILAFVVSDFEYVSTTGPNGLKIRVWTRREYINNTDYTLGNLPMAYEFFEDYFNISEVVTKADHFAAPDFSAGAMENWGLVLYRESALVYDKNKSLLEDEFFVLLVMCHEVSHSWFGNMATLKWWDNVWLNEAFANTLMYFAMDYIKPEFHVHDTLVVHDIFAVIEKDSLETTHPVSTYVEDPRKIQMYFDEISYEKGLAVLRMLRGFIGDEDFKRSIRNHIKKFMFSNCDMNDLFEVISETVDNKFNVSNIMKGWLTQPGYPIVNVTRRIDEASNEIIYELKQEYFLLYQSKKNKEKYLWTIPFTYKVEGMDQGQLIWFNTTRSSIKLPFEGEDKWLIGNLNFMGYYRINYDTQGWLNIIAQLKKDHTVFSATERASLIFDCFTFARIGYVDYSIAMDLASYLVNEEDYVPWKSYFKSITYIDNLLSTSSCYGLFQQYGSKQLSKIYQKLGWENDGSFLEKLLRTHVLKYSAYFENDDATEKSRQIFSDYLVKNIEPYKHVKEAAFCTGIKYGNPKQWVGLMNSSLTALPAVQNVIWHSLVCSKDLWVLKSFLEMTLNETLIRRSDVRRVYTYYGLTALSRSVYFEFVMKNWESLFERYKSDIFIMSTILETLPIGITDEYMLKRVEGVLSKVEFTSDLIINQIKTNIKWFNSYENQICGFLEKRKQDLIY